MAKIRENKSGNKYQKEKVTSYSVSIPKSVFEISGLTLQDNIIGTTDSNGTITIKKCTD